MKTAQIANAIQFCMACHRILVLSNHDEEIVRRSFGPWLAKASSKARLKNGFTVRWGRFDESEENQAYLEARERANVAYFLYVRLASDRSDKEMRR